MIKKHRILLARLLFMGDLAVVFCSWVLAYFLRFYIDLIPAPKGIYSFSYHMSLAIVILTLWGMALQLSGLYKFRRLTSRSKTFKKILNASLMGTLAFIVSTYLFQEYRFSRGVVGYFFATSFLLLLSFRFWVREIIFYLRKRGYNLRYAIIVGEGDLAQTTASQIDKRSETGVKILGFVSPDPQYQKNPRTIGALQDLPALIKEKGADQVIIALDSKVYAHMDRVLQQLRYETIDIKIVPDFYKYASLNYDVEELGGLPFITLNDTPLDGWNTLLKRSLDIVLGTLFFIGSIPLGVGVACFIKIFSPGPVFYKQERMGLDGKKFKLYKFRTMKMDAEKESGAIWAAPDDPRRTRLGKFLRSSSMDEIPQFLNVIKGDMSLVGPRPERPVFVDRFKTHYPNYMLRHKVKAGLTGWAQVNGWRGNTSLDKRIEYDLYYIKHWSALFDLKIIWLTFWKGIFHKNAY